MNPAKRRIEFLPHLPERRRERRAPSDQHVIVAAMHAAALRKPHHLAQPAPYPVALHRIADLPRHREADAHRTVLGAAAWATNADLVRTSADLIGADVLDRLRRSSTITEADLAAARVTIAGWRAALDDLWRQVDVLAAPTLLGFPALIEDAATMMALRGLTSPVNVAGVPSLAMPVPAGGPLPASVQLIGPANSEDRLLAAGAVLEAALRG